MLARQVVFALSAIYMLSGCASIIEGTSQTITVETNPPGATCKFLRDGRVIANVVNTPAGVVVEKTKHDIRIECSKEKYQVGTTSLHSGAAGATFGNIILGGGIGWAIDSASGADNKYAEYATISLVPEIGATNLEGFSPPLLPGFWRTTSDMTLAFANYAGDGESVIMPSFVKLKLVEKREDWGRFEYDGEKGGKAHAWIRMAEVTNIPE